MLNFDVAELLEDHLDSFSPLECRLFFDLFAHDICSDMSKIKCPAHNVLRVSLDIVRWVLVNHVRDFHALISECRNHKFWFSVVFANVVFYTSLVDSIPASDSDYVYLPDVPHAIFLRDTVG
jgi:hypothetical protein